MIDEPDLNDKSLPIPVLERIDRVCLDFEAAWKAGRGPRIEDYLGDTQGAERGQLLRELLLLELDYRSRSDEQPAPDEYQARFPQDSQLVSDVFEQLSTGAAEGDTAPHRPAAISPQQTLPAAFGDYELLEVLGEGGMGVVFRARKRTPDRVVALKIIRPDRLGAVLPDERDKAVERFRAEVQAAARLEHDHIVPVYDAGEIDGQPFLAMRYVEGRGLDEVLRDGPLDGREAAALLERVARAVHYAHGRDVVHRDIKPRNILLDTSDRPYVVDFGLAKSFAAAQELTQTQDLLGTPAYMSPEQARGPAGVDHRTDVYSLGATLYELLTGRPPFRAATPAETQRQVIDNEPVPPRQLNPAVPRDLETICLKCLEKDPRNRYSTAAEVAEELARFRQRRPIRARPIGRVQRFWRWCRRNPAVAGLAGTAATLLVLAAVAATVGYVQTSAALARESEQLRATQEREDELRLAQQKVREALEEAESSLYFHRITLAHRELLANHIGQAERMLDACPPSRRHWEWHHLKRLCHAELLEFGRSKGPVTGLHVGGLAFSPDGLQIASRCEGCAVKVSSATSGEEVLRLIGHAGPVTAVAFSPDGTRIATVSEDDPLVRVWDASTGQEALTLMKPPRAKCAFVAFGPEGKRLACGDMVWDADTGQETLALEGSVGFAAFSPDGERIAAIADGTALTILNSLTGEELLRLPGHEEGIVDVAFSPEGKYLAVANRSQNEPSLSGDVRIWDTENGDPVHSLLADSGSLETSRALVVPIPHGMAVIGPFFGATSVAFSPDGRRLATTSIDRTVKVWDVTTGEKLFTLPGHEGWAVAVAFSPDARRLASMGSEGTVKIWDARSSPGTLSLEGLTDDVTDLVFRPDGKQVAASSIDGTVKIWDTASGREVTTFTGHVIQVSFDSPSGASPLRPAGVTSLAFSPDGKRIASASYNKTVQLWDAKTGREILVLRGHTGPVHSVTFSPDGKCVATAGDDDEVKIWDVETGREILAAVGELGMVTHLQFSRDGGCIVSRDSDELKFWNSTTGEEMHTLPVRHFMALSPDWKRIATSDGNTTVVWDRESRREILSLQGHTQGVGDAVFSPDGRRIASAASDQTVKIWDAETGRELLTLPSVGGSVRFSPDGCHIASATPRPSNYALEFGAGGRRSFTPIYTGAWSPVVTLLDATPFPETADSLLDAPERDTFRIMGFTGYLRFLPDDDLLVGTEDGTVIRLDAQGRGVKKRYSSGLRGASNLVGSGDGRRLAVLRRHQLELIELPTGDSIRTVGVPDFGVDGAAFSPDSQRVAVLVSSDYDKEQKRWNTPEGGNLRIHSALDGTFLFSEKTPPLSGGWQSMDWKGNVIALAETCDDDDGILLWDVARHRGLHKLVHPDPDRGALCVAISPDAKKVAVGYAPWGVGLWDAASGELLKDFSGHDNWVVSLDFSPDGRRLASGAGDHSVLVRDVETGACIERFAMQAGYTYSVSFDSTGRHLACGTEDGRVVIRNVRALASAHDGQESREKTNREWLELLRREDAATRQKAAFALARSGRLSDAVVKDVVAVLIEALQEEDVIARQRAAFALGEFRSAATDAIPVLAQALQDEDASVRERAGVALGSIRPVPEDVIPPLRNAADLLFRRGVAHHHAGKYEECLKVLTTASRIQSALPGDPNPRALACMATAHFQLGHTSETRTYLDRLRGMRLTGKDPEGFLSEAESLITDPDRYAFDLEHSTGYARFLADGNLLIGTEDGTILHFDARQKEITAEYASESRGASDLVVSGDGRRLAVVRKSQLELIDLPTGESVCTIAVPDFDVTYASFSPDSQRLAVLVSSEYDEEQERWNTPEDGNLRIHSAIDGVFLYAEETPPLSGGWQSMDWKGNLIAVPEAYDEERGVLLWDAVRHTRLHKLVHPDPDRGALCVAMSPDAKKVAVGYAPNGVALWDAEGGKLLRDLKGHTNWVVSLDFSPDGQRLASGAGDSTVRVWDVETGASVERFSMQAGYTYSVSFDSAGGHLACGARGGKVVIWTVR